MNKKIRSAYPIVKYPVAIAKKLSILQTTVQETTDVIAESPIDDIFASFFIHEAKTKSLANYPLYAIVLFWLGVAAAIYLHKISSQVLILSGAATVIAIAIYFFALFKTEARNKQVISANRVKAKQIAAAEKTEKVEQPPARTDALIVQYNPNKNNKQHKWQSEANNLLRSTQSSSANIGASERFFLNRLKKTFPQATFGFAYLPDGYNRPYSSDIEIILSNGIGIQIEIDEPYVYKTREPHHCCDNNKDDSRDEFFLQSGWIVIRFSEYQIITSTDDCIATIAGVAAKINENRQLIELVNRSNRLKPDPRWTAKEAGLMAKRKYRESYLASVNLSKVPIATIATTKTPGRKKKKR